MTDSKKKPDTKQATDKDDKPYSVSSSPGTPRTINFQVPNMPNMPDWRKHARHVRSLGVGAVIAVIVLAGLAGYGGAWLQDHGNGGLVTGSVGSGKKVVTSQSQLISQIAKTVGPSVV